MANPDVAVGGQTVAGKPARPSPARTFVRAQTNRVADLLEILTDLGQARRMEDGRYS